MKVLVLGSIDKERSLIQDAIDKGRHEAFFAENAEQALKLFESGQLRFAIILSGPGSSQGSNLVQSIRAATKSPVYILALTSADADVADVDDTLRRPFTAAELAARILSGKRILSLGDDLTAARDQIEHLALYDMLTGVMNRGAFFRTARGELERARRGSAPLCLIALDLDNFKSINDTYGMQTGDEVLKIVAQTIREKSRPYDCIGRWTADEFVLALPGVIGEDAEKIAERIIKGVRSTQITSRKNILNVGMSAGIAAVLRISASTEVEPLIEQARQALARAKEAGGNQVNLAYV